MYYNSTNLNASNASLYNAMYMCMSLLDCKLGFRLILNGCID